MSQNVMLKTRVVIYCSDIGFSKKFEFWDEDNIPVIGEEFTVELFSGKEWKVRAFNVIKPTEHDLYVTYFFKSVDYELFEILCDSLTAERGWKELNQ